MNISQWSLPQLSIKLVPSVYKGSKKPGDFKWEIENGSKNTLYIFNDDVKQHKTSRSTPGNAVIRNYNKYGKHKPPLSAGISTGWKPGGKQYGFKVLDTEVKQIIDSEIEEIKTLVQTGNYQFIKYSADPKDLSMVGIKLFDVGDDVRRYIVSQLQQISQS